MNNLDIIRKGIGRNFKKKLSYLLEHEKLNALYFSNLVELSKKTIDNYLQGNTLPDMEFFNSLNHYFYTKGQSFNFNYFFSNKADSLYAIDTFYFEFVIQLFKLIYDTKNKIAPNHEKTYLNAIIEIVDNLDYDEISKIAEFKESEDSKGQSSYLVDKEKQRQLKKERTDKFTQLFKEIYKVQKKRQ